TEIRVDQSVTSGSRFPKPGYRFTSRSLDLTQVLQPLTEPNSGQPVGNPHDPDGPKDKVWKIDSRPNFFYIWPVPILYWPPFVDQPYFGYFDLWGIKASGRDVLAPGPAVVTDGPPFAGLAKFQRISVPAFQDFRGRLTFRHMQSLLGPDAGDDEDRRLQLEVGYSSDRHFIEEYSKRLFDSGLDQEPLAYVIRQKENRAFPAQTEANLQ